MNQTIRRAHGIRREATARFGGRPGEYSMKIACEMAKAEEHICAVGKKKEAAQERIDRMMEIINNGHTVYLQTSCKTMMITLKTVAKFKKAGCDIFKVDSDGHVRMFIGGKYLIIDGCHASYV